MLMHKQKDVSINNKPISEFQSIYEILKCQNDLGS